MRLHCPSCNSQREGECCFKCGGKLIVPDDEWEYPELPPVDRIRELAKEVGYAIGEHGSKQRDLDVIAVPWTEEAVSAEQLLVHIAGGLDARLLDIEDRPHGRIAASIQMNGWFRLIDISVFPIKPKEGP